MGDESFIAAHNALSPFSRDSEADRKTLYQAETKADGERRGLRYRIRDARQALFNICIRLKAYKEAGLNFS